jgi:tetratricopeptide (TPR) repeat protein
LYYTQAMTAEREAQFKQLTAEFPDSPMGHFSLGRYYLDEKRWAEARPCFERAAALDPGYAAAFVGLGDAAVGLGLKDEAKAAWRKALDTPLGRRDASLQADLEQRARDLDDF